MKKTLIKGILTATVPTVSVNKTLHWDVIILILLFAVTMFISQKNNDGNDKNRICRPYTTGSSKIYGNIHAS